MKEILYDVFVRGVVPLALVGTLGYLAKSFFEKHKSESSKLLRRISLVLVWMFSVYMIYDYFSVGYLKDYVPGETSIVGAISVADSSGVYWEIDSSRTYSLPLRVRPNRVLLLKLNLSQYPIKVTYQIRDEYHSLILRNPDEPLFDVLLEELTHNQSAISQDITIDGERLLNLRFQVDKSVKLFSFSLVRFYPTANQIGVNALFCLLFGYLYFMIDKLFKHLQSKQNSVLPPNQALKLTE
jgi:hypothetical protein